MSLNRSMADDGKSQSGEPKSVKLFLEILGADEKLKTWEIADFPYNMGGFVVLILPGGRRSWIGADAIRSMETYYGEVPKSPDSLQPNEIGFKSV